MEPLTKLNGLWLVSSYQYVLSGQFAMSTCLASTVLYIIDTHLSSYLCLFCHFSHFTILLDLSIIDLAIIFNICLLLITVLSCVFYHFLDYLYNFHQNVFLIISRILHCHF
jgi:hypothetical protein